MRGSDARDGARMLDLAVHDNARWCRLVSATWGSEGVTDQDAWTSPVRTPPGYPDAVVLRPGVGAGSLLPRIDTSSPGCSVKDSYADLDLTSHGFDELFSATWIGLAPTAEGVASQTAPWQPVDRDTLPAWVDAWADGTSGSTVFRPELLEAPGVTVLGAWRGPVVIAGCVLTAGDAAVGVSNLFVRDGSPRTAWRDVLAWVAAHHPGRAVVGYEAGDELAVALEAGFTPLGPLRVWLAP